MSKVLNKYITALHKIDNTFCFLSNCNMSKLEVNQIAEKK